MCLTFCFSARSFRNGVSGLGYEIIWDGSAGWVSGKYPLGDLLGPRSWGLLNHRLLY